MTNIDDVFAAIPDAQAITVDDSVDFVIDSNLRVISIPVRGVVLGVEGDKDVNRVTFLMPKMYKGVDLSTFQIRINYANANGEKSFFKVTEKSVVNDQIRFIWVVSADAVAYKGDVEFVVRFVKLNGSTVVQELNTTLTTAKSLTGLSVDNEITPVQREDLLAHFYSEIDTYSEQKKNEILGSIPDDYQVLDEKIKNVVREKGSETESTKISYDGTGDEYEVPDMEEFNELKSDLTNLKTDTDEYVVKRIRGSVVTSKAPSLVLRYTCQVNKGDKVSVQSEYDGSNIQIYDIRFYDVSGNIHVIAQAVPIRKEYIFVAEENYSEISLYTSITDPIEGKKFETVVSINGELVNEIHQMDLKQKRQETDIVKLRSDISDKYNQEYKNLLDISKAAENKSINFDTGKIVDNLTGYWLASDFIYLKSNTKYYCNGIFMNGIYAFYADENENTFIKNPDKVKVHSNSSSNYTNGYIETGDSTLYLRCSISTSQKDSAYISEFADAYTPHEAMHLEDFIAMTAESSKLKNKKILVVGDSISTDYYGSYPKWVTVLMNERYLPLDTINDSIHATGFVADAGTTGNDFLSRLKAIENKSDFDLVIVFGGINDYSLYKKEENISDTFTTAVDSFFEYLINNYINARVGTIKPMLCNRPGGADDADKIRLYADYIENTAKKYAIPVLNMTDESGFNPFITQIYERWSLLPSGQELHDGIHPNEEFERKFMAPQIKHFIDGLI